MGQILNRISEFILEPLIRLLFVAATIIFIWGVIQYVISGREDGGSDNNDRLQGKRAIMWGLIGMFIMGSVYGIINVLLGTFDIPNPFFP